MEITSARPLNNGVRIPYLGLGTYQSAPGRETYDAVRAALATGYRLLDTAAVYRNESDVGRAIRDSNVPREEIFVTTKLWTRDEGFAPAIAACERSLKELGLEYVDLYLIHWPGSRVRWESWQALEKLYREKKCRAIGVSNYLDRHLLEILKRFEVVPAVNQVELSPFLSQAGLRSFCRRRAIQVMAYAPLTQGKKLDHPVVQGIAKKVAKTPAQVLVRWALQQELVVIPKSVRKERIEENAAVFDFALDAGDMEKLGALDEGFRTCWDPTDVR